MRVSRMHPHPWSAALIGHVNTYDRAREHNDAAAMPGDFANDHDLDEGGQGDVFVFMRR